MKDRKINKLIIFIVTIILTLSICTSSFALTMITPVQVTGQEKIATIGGMILSIVQIIGVSVAVIILVVLAIKYMVSSPSERADIKKSAIPYVIGALLLFGGSGILAIIVSLGNSINNTTGSGGTSAPIQTVTQTITPPTIYET